MSTNPTKRARPWWRATPVLIMLLASVVLVSPQAFATQHQPSKKASPISVPSPGTDLWRSIRQSVPGSSQAQGIEAAVLINPAGDEWRALRTGPVLRYTGWTMFGIVLALLAFYIFRGPIRIRGGRSGRSVQRWAVWERGLHWYTAILFVIMALTGLSLLFGRVVMLPVLGPGAFGAWAQAAKSLHNYLGLFFVVGVLAMIIAFVKHNLPTTHDLVWFAKGGGFVGDAHPPAGRVNAGEKLFTFWVMATVGVIACVTGLILDFPDFVSSREAMQQANVWHAISTVVWMFFALGHIYLGTAGVEGTFEGMWEGKVDVNWAKQHHDLWYEEVKQNEGNEPADPHEVDTIIRGQTS